jgi:hypothetical protein
MSERELYEASAVSAARGELNRESWLSRNGRGGAWRLGRGLLEEEVASDDEKSIYPGGIRNPIRNPIQLGAG